MSRFAALLVFLFVACAQAIKPLGQEVCLASCSYALLKTKFAGKDEKAQTNCKHPLRVQSVYYCVAIHCKPEDVSAGINWWMGECQNSTKAINVKAYETAVSNATDAYLKSLPTVELKSKGVLNGTAVPSAKSWSVVHTSVFTYSEMREYGNAVRWIPYGLWAIVLLAGMANNAWTRLRPTASRASLTDKTTGQTALSKFTSWIKFNVVVAPTFKHRHHQPWGWFSVPLRLQTIVIISYVIIHIAICAVNYPIYDESYYYSNKPTQVLRYFADRLGALVSSSLPLIFLFGARSNPFVPLTGWSYGVFSSFHRWIAIILLIEGIIHGIAFSAYYVHNKDWATYRENLRDDEKFLYGIMMAIALGISVSFAHLEIRKRLYELFKTIHIVMAAICLAAYYEHVKVQFKGFYNIWTWICVGIWGADYVIRFARVVVMNYKILLGKDTRAMASYSDDTCMIRLQVHSSTPSKAQTPGQYYFLYLGGRRFWQAHPFTLAGRSTEAQETIPAGTGEKSASKAPTQVTTTQSASSDPYLTFMIRPRTGMTRSLRDQITKGERQGQTRMKVVLEGPYGGPAALDRFTDVLFIAGGSGITAVLPYIRSIFEVASESSRVPNVRLVWAAQQEAFVRDVLANDLNQVEASPVSATHLRQEFYITSTASSSRGTSVSGSNESDKSDSRFAWRRPEMAAVVNSFLESAAGPAAAFICGPATMADDARAAVIKYGKSSTKEVELFEEMYGW